MKDAEQPNDNKEEMDEVSDDKSPNGTEKVKDEPFKDNEQLEDDNRCQEAPGIAAGCLLSGSLQR